MTNAKPGKKYGAAVKFAVLTLALVQNTQALCAPTLGPLAAMFPETDTTLVQMVYTIPTLVMIVSSLVVGVTSRKLGYKWSGLLAMLFSLVGGVLPAIFHPSIAALVVERAIFGIGYGLVFGLAVAACGDFWRGKETSSMIGLVTAFIGVGGMIYSAVAGALADISWTAPYWFYAIIIVWAIYYWIFMPNRPELDDVLESAPVAPVEKQKFSLAGFGSKYWAFLIAAAICTAMLYAFLNNASIIVLGLGIGSNATTGAIMTAFSLGIMLGGLVYPICARVLRRLCVPVWMAIVGLFLLINMLVPNLPLFFIGGFINGMGFGIINAAWGDMANKKPIDPSRSADGSSFYLAIQGVGIFVGPFWLAGLAGMVGLDSNNLFYQWVPAIALLFIGAVILAVIAIIKKNKVDYEN